MSERPAIRLTGIGKRYTLYTSPVARACDALGLGWLLPGRLKPARHLWAVRNIHLTLPRGARIGIIGRNGAGKSTLMKLITGNVDPTEGEIEVNGEVQALLQAGTGMHPEFTGYQNIEASLTYQGLGAAAIRDAVADIEEFTELGGFLDQPFKTYSTGMQARLAFATATVAKPDILIVDELLGVGDGYFLSKSTERMRKLIEGGASVLLVSHSMEQILRFCDQAIWVDRGQIVQQGDALEVVKAYDHYLRLLDERRLLAKNRRLHSVDAVKLGDEVSYADALLVRFRVAGSARLKVGELVLSENDRPQDRLHVGGPQDTAPGNVARLRAETADAWSPPVCHERRMYRELSGQPQPGCGEAVFPLYLYDSSVTYAFDIEYCLEGSGATVEMCREGVVLHSAELIPTAAWGSARVVCVSPDQGRAASIRTGKPSTLKVVHWPGCLGGLRIERVQLLDEEGREAAQFLFGKTVTLEMQIRADEDGVYPLVPALSVCRRSDGVIVSQHIGPRGTWTLRAGDTLTARLHLEPLLLGNDTYVVGMGLFRRLDPMQVEEPERYDMLDRSVEFSVHGREPYRRGIFQHPGQWEVEPGHLPAQIKSA
jgi:ABC-type polysaccharide/polyol phosphate transport system ATPase subunit